MGLDGKKMAAGLKHLSQVNKIKQVEPLSYALFPGYHCPLMGAMMTIASIKDSVMLVIGPDECAYYTMMATSGGGAMGADGCRIVAVVLDQHDVTFGCRQSLERAFEELSAEMHPRAVYVVTTCVPEIIGDDVDSMAEGFAAQYGFPVMVVHAENFKTDDHLPGIAHTLEASAALMKKRDCDGSVNVLGLRLGDFTKSELYAILCEEKIPVGMTLPGKSSVDIIQNAAAAKVNVVVHPVGFPLAQKMQEQFGIPYVDFQRYCDPEHILESYRKLFAALEKPLPEKVQKLYEEAKALTEKAEAAIGGGTYFSGNTAMCTYEFHAFLTRIGLRPSLLQISALEEEDMPFVEEILRHCDPYVTRAANIGPLKYLYPVLKPDYNVGAGNMTGMQAAGTQMVSMGGAYDLLGFEVNEMVINAFRRARERKAARSAGMPMPPMPGGMPPGMGRMPGMAGKPGMPGMGRMPGMAGMNAMPDPAGMAGMAGKTAMAGMPGMNSMPGMTGMSAMNGMPGMGSMPGKPDTSAEAAVSGPDKQPGSIATTKKEENP